MALGLIKVEGRFARGILLIGILASIVAAFTFAKWCFANAVSPRSATADVADMTITLSPDDPQTHFAAAVLYERTFLNEDIGRSLEEYEKAAALSPNNYLAWLELGKARGRNGDLAGSESAFIRALALAPNYADVHWSYGNLLLRAGRIDEGFEHIRLSVSGNPELTASAAVTAMSFLDGSSDNVRKVLGNSGEVNAALTAYALSRKQLDEAVADWNQIERGDQHKRFSETGRNLLARLTEAGQFRSAAAVARDIWDDPGEGPAVGRLFNGDFELPVRLKDARTFDWQIGAGAEPQIAMSDAQRHDGSLSLYLVFNTMQAAEFRSVYQTVAVEPSASYTFEAFFRADLKGSLAWEIVEAGSSKALARTGPLTSAPDWTLARTTFNVPAGIDGITIRLVRDGCVTSVCPISGKIWIDSLSLVRRETTPTNK